MRKATKSEVQALARRHRYELGAARRGIATDWIVELWGEYEGRQVLVREARAFQLAEAYGGLAVWLRARADRKAVS